MHYLCRSIAELPFTEELVDGSLCMVGAVWIYWQRSMYVLLSIKCYLFILCWL